jgi:GxxExxY protein
MGIFIVWRILDRQDTKTPRKQIPVSTDRVAQQVVDAAYAIHSTLGPGLLENVYEMCLAYELSKRGLKFRKQVELPVTYGAVHLDAGLRLDLVVEECLVVELKAVENLKPLHTAQLLTYLKLSGYRLGLLINFNVPVIRDGIRRIAL